MKYLSLVVVGAFIAFTFWFSKKTEELTIDQKNKMNNLIKQYMTQAVQNNQPDASEIEFSTIHTETVETGKKMKAHFKFSYVEPNKDGGMEKVYRKGTFLITSEDGQKWKAQIESAGDIKVEFMEPFDISGDSQAAPSDDDTSENSDQNSEPEQSNTDS
ncbi:MAG: hypothetical protein AAF203_04820 [Pseudomonadota bacterium]